MKLVIIFGPHAVGKMTVGQALAAKTGLKLFHNHMTIEVVSDLFDGVPGERGRLTELFRHEIFDAFSRTDQYGMIFTFMWALDQQSDWDYIAGVEKMFKDRGAEVYYVELAADYDLRIERNRTPNRLMHKASKRNIEKSEQLFRYLEDKYRLNSFEGEMLMENYIKIHNDDLSPDEVADRIRERFSL